MKQISIRCNRIEIAMCSGGRENSSRLLSRQKALSQKHYIIWVSTMKGITCVGVTFDRALCYKERIHKMKCKTSARNNILRKLSNRKWGAKPATIKTTVIALCYSTAEYACPVWERLKHESKLDPALNEACRFITRGLRPTSVENVYLLVGIVPIA